MEFISDHWVLSIVVAIILGAIGSGIWETLLKPISVKIIKVLFSVVTFGRARARDSIYREAARGHHDLPGLYVFMFVMGFLVVPIIIAPTVLAMSISFNADSYITERCELANTHEEIADCKLDEIRKEIRDHLPLMVVAVLFISVFSFYQYMYVNLSNTITTYFEQCYKICAPFLSEEGRLKAHQRFALIEDKESFVDLIQELATVAEKNGVQLPQRYF